MQITYYSHAFPLFVGEVKGDPYRWFSLTVRFEKKLSTAQKDFIKTHKPGFLRSTPIIMKGRMLTVGIGKIVSRMATEDSKDMLDLSEKNKTKYKVPYDFTFYIPDFKSREDLDKDVEAWLVQLHEICPVQLALRDETDLGKYRYPGGDWSLVSDLIMTWHENSLSRAGRLISSIATEPDVYQQTGDEKKIFSYCINSINGLVEGTVLDDHPSLAEFVISEEVLEKKILSGDVSGILRMIKENTSRGFVNITTLIYTGELIYNDLNGAIAKEKIAPTTIFNIARGIFSIHNAWEICFGSGYKMSLIAKLAVLRKEKGIIELIGKFIKSVRFRSGGFVEWIGYKAEEFLRRKMYGEAIELYKIILPVDVLEDRSQNYIATYPNALYSITERSTGIKHDDDLIDYFLERCMLQAPGCAAIYANAALLYIQRGNFQEAFNSYKAAFDTPSSTWPDKKVKIDLSTYTNALWVLLKENSGLKIHYATIEYFIEKCLPHAVENPAIYCNITHVYAQEGELKKAYHYFLLTEKFDTGNFELLLREIETLPSLSKFKDFLKEKTI